VPLSTQHAIHQNPTSFAKIFSMEKAPTLCSQLATVDLYTNSNCDYASDIDEAIKYNMIRVASAWTNSLGSVTHFMPTFKVKNSGLEPQKMQWLPLTWGSPKSSNESWHPLSPEPVQKTITSAERNGMARSRTHDFCHTSNASHHQMASTGVCSTIMS